ncbi:MAG: lipocalin family protein [Alistipes sp.]
MKQFFSLLSLATVAVLSACSPAPKAPLTMQGTVIDATMNNIFLKATSGDSICLSTMDADPAMVPGVLIADSISVVYKDTLDMKVVTELTILRKSPYFYIQGEWVEPNPIDAAQVQGFNIKQDGSVEMINMATLSYTHWDFDLKDLILQGQSMGNGQTIDFADTMNVVKLDADTLILSKNGEVVFKLARKK